MADVAQIKPHETPPLWRPAVMRAAVAIVLATGLRMGAADTGMALWLGSHPWLGAAGLLAWLVLAHLVWDRQRWRLLRRFRKLLDDSPPQGAAFGS